jgi:DNA adenine methylase
MVVKPLLKWIGGKTQILDVILSKFPREINTYYEPFIGGGSVLIGLLQDPSIKINGKIIVSDKNEKLINFYNNVIHNPLGIDNELKRIFTDYNSLEFIKILIDRNPDSFDAAMTSQESYYYYIRSRFNSLNNFKTVEASAMFLFLNKACFRGMYREGPNGFNVPFGNYKSLTYGNIGEFSELIRNVVFLHAPYQDILNRFLSLQGHFIYLDPPYVVENKTSFVSYTRDGFDENDSLVLFDTLKKTRCKWLMSNSSTPIVLESFKDYEKESILCKRSVNSKNPGSKVFEVLIKN